MQLKSDHAWYLLGRMFEENLIEKSKTFDEKYKMVLKNFQKAEKCYEEAWQLGSLDALTDLAYHYQKGSLGLQKNEDKALKLYEMAKLKQFPRAINYLGLFFL